MVACNCEGLSQEGGWEKFTENILPMIKAFQMKPFSARFILTVPLRGRGMHDGGVELVKRKKVFFVE